MTSGFQAQAWAVLKSPTLLYLFFCFVFFGGWGLWWLAVVRSFGKNVAIRSNSVELPWLFHGSPLWACGGKARPWQQAFSQFSVAAAISYALILEWRQVVLTLLLFRIIFFHHIMLIFDSLYLNSRRSIAATHNQPHCIISLYFCIPRKRFLFLKKIHHQPPLCNTSQPAPSLWLVTSSVAVELHFLSFLVQDLRVNENSLQFQWGNTAISWRLSSQFNRGYQNCTMEPGTATNAKTLVT